MSNQNQFFPQDYGFNQPLNPVFPIPIVSKRTPTTADKAQLGRLWVIPSSNSVYVLTSIVANSANWADISGGAGVFSSLMVNPGPVSLSTVGNGAVSIGNATNTGAITMTVGTGNLAIVGGGNTIDIGADAAANNLVLGSSTAGALTSLIGGNGTGVGTAAVIIGSAAAGDIQIGAPAHTGVIYLGVSTAGETIRVGSGAAANTIAIGNTTAGTTLALNTPTSTPVVAANGLTATVGNITASNGNVVLSTAATFVQLPGPIKIMSGAGAPANGLAAEAGDLYVRTDPAGATSRIYVATGAGAWTNVTCAA